MGWYFINVHVYKLLSIINIFRQITHNSPFFVLNIIESSLSCDTVALTFSLFHSDTVDITVYHNGFHGDLNETFYVGEVDEGAKTLVQTTYECLMQAIDSGRNCYFHSLTNCGDFSNLTFTLHCKGAFKPCQICLYLNVEMLH